MSQEQLPPSPTYPHIAPPQANKKTIKNAAAATLVLIILIISASLWVIYAPYGSQQLRTVDITPGLGSRKIGALLKKEGFVRSKWMFVTYVSLRGEASHLKPGVYTFGKIAIPDIAQQLLAGTSREREITFPEGWTIDEIGSRLDEQGIMYAENFRAAAETPNLAKLRKKFLPLNDIRDHASLEGYLFPDTYRLYAATDPERVIEVFLTNFDAKLSSQMREEIRKQQKTIHDIVIMASLIEKEVVSDEDRKIVSGILWKRLQLGIPLQVDATLLYIKKTRARANTADEKLINADKKIDSPYNTYLYRGLPQGPIGNPGLSAMNAAISPKTSPYLYYLSAPDGRTIFSRTLEEHNVAKAKYLQ